MSCTYLSRLCGVMITIGELPPASKPRTHVACTLARTLHNMRTARTRAPRTGAARLQTAPRRRLGRQPLGGRGTVAAAARGGRAGGHIAGRRGGDHARCPRARHLPAAARRRDGAAGRRRAARVLARRAAPPGTAARPRRHLALRVRLVGGRRRRAALRRVVRGGGAQRRPRRLPLAGPACCKRRLGGATARRHLGRLRHEASAGLGALRRVEARLRRLGAVGGCSYCCPEPVPTPALIVRLPTPRPQRGDLSILGASRAAEARTGFKDCRLPEWMAALPMVRLRLREDVIAAGERSGHQATRCTTEFLRAARAMHTARIRHAYAMHCRQLRTSCSTCCTSQSRPRATCPSCAGCCSPPPTSPPRRGATRAGSSSARAILVPVLATVEPAHAATRRSSSPPACARLPSRAVRRALASWA